MTEPRRYLDDPSAPALARVLLGSAESDAPEPGAARAAAKRLGIAAGLVAGTKAASASAIALWTIGTIVLGAIAVTVAIAREPSAVRELAPTHQSSGRAQVTAPALPPTTTPPSTPSASIPLPPSPPPEPPVASSRPVRVKPAPAEPPPVASNRPVRTDPAPVVAEPAPVVAEPAPVESTSVSVVPVEPPIVAEPPAPTADRLAAEVAALDRARGQLRAKSYVAALASVHEYLASFPDGALRAEATVVEIEALVETGRAAEARTAAAAFVQTFPQSPLVRRVRALVARTKETR